MNKSQIIESNEYINENNERKRKYSLELELSCPNFNKNDEPNSNLNIYNELIKDDFNHFIKNINKSKNKLKEKSQKHQNTKNKKQNKENNYKDISDSDEEILSFLNKNNYINNNQYKLLLQKIKLNPNPIGIKKKFYFNKYNASSTRSKTSINISSSKSNYKNKNILSLENGLLVNLTKYLLEKYKLSDKDKYSPINSKIKYDLKGSDKLNKQLNEVEDINNINRNDEQYYKDDEEDKIMIINLFGLSIKVKNIKNALKNYLIKRKLTLTELYQMIERKNKISKLIIKLAKEKKEKRRKKRRKSKKSILEIKNSNLDILKFLNNVEEAENEIININKENEIKKEKEKKVKTLKDIEKRKMRLLLKFKNDIDYKIKTGDMNVSDIDIFSKLQEKLDKLINFYNINENEKKIEDFAGDFHEEMELFEQRKKDERRINAFINDLNDQINYKSKKKKVIEDTFCNVVNYDSVNRMNILNKI